MPVEGGKGGWLVAGGLNLDILAKARDSFKLYDSNPGSIGERPGGVGFNIARNLALLGEPVHFLTARGRDGVGDKLFQAAREKGLDLSLALVREAWSSARYLAIHDQAGDMVAAINDMSLFDSLTPDEIQPWSGAGLGEEEGRPAFSGAFLEANLPEPVLQELAAHWDLPLFADAVSLAKVDRLLPLLPRLAGFKLNRMEAGQLTGLAGGSRRAAVRAAREIADRGVGRVCLSLGIEGALFTDGRLTVHARPPLIVQEANATGAGDAMAAAFAWASVRAYDLYETARLAAAAASLTVESAEAVNPDLTLEALKTRAVGIKVEEVR